MKFVESKLNNNTKTFLEDELKATITSNLKKKIEMFDKYLCISKDGTDYDNLDDTISNALNNWADGESSKEVLNHLKITEEYLKSLVNLFNPADYERIMSEASSFRELIIFLGMTKLKRTGNLDLILYESEIERGMTLEEKYKNDSNQYHWAVGYTFRNEYSHTHKKYGYKETINYIYSVLYVLLETTWKYGPKIERMYTDKLIFDGINKNGYFNKVTEVYEKKNLQNTFVVMSIINEDSKKTELVNKVDEEDEENVEKTNLIPSLDIMKVADHHKNYRKLIGEAGLGKSRLMRYLQYKDAKEREMFPVYVELKELSDLQLTTKELIAIKAGLNEEACDLLMQIGGMSLYLDGINEILCSDNDKRIICGQISDLAKEYPKTKILVTDRENSYITVKGIPTYLLVKLDETLVHEFISKNARDEETKEKIYKILGEEKYLYDIVKTPFMLEAFISLVENNEYTSDITNESKLSGKFVECLIRRESEEKLEGRASKIKFLLAHLFIKNGKCDDKISVFTENQILFQFKRCMEFYSFQVDSVEILELIVQMGILVKSQDEKYSFANEFYKDHFRHQGRELLRELED